MSPVFEDDFSSREAMDFHVSAKEIRQEVSKGCEDRHDNFLSAIKYTPPNALLIL
jgi:hypothetical protein